MLKKSVKKRASRNTNENFAVNNLKKSRKSFVDEDLMHTLEQKGFRRGEIKIPSQLQKQLNAANKVKTRRVKKPRIKREVKEKITIQPIQPQIPVPLPVQRQEEIKKEEIREIVPVREEVLQKQKKEGFFKKISKLFAKKKEMPKAFPQLEIKRKTEEEPVKEEVKREKIEAPKILKKPVSEETTFALPALKKREEPIEKPTAIVKEELKEEVKVPEIEKEEIIEKPTAIVKEELKEEVKVPKIEKEEIIEKPTAIVKEEVEDDAKKEEYVQVPEIISAVPSEPEEPEKTSFFSRIFGKKKRDDELEPIKIMAKKEEFKHKSMANEKEERRTQGSVQNQVASSIGILFSEPKKKKLE